MTDQEKASSLPAACWSGMVITGILGLVIGYAVATLRNGENLEVANSLSKEIERLKENKQRQERYVQVSEMMNDAMVTYAMGDTSPKDITIEEAQDLVERLNDIGQADEIAQTQFVNEMNFIKAEYDKDMQSAPPNIRSWRDLAKHWEAEYKAK